MTKSKKLRIIFAFLLVGWMALIFFMSAQPADQSSKLSGGVVSKLIAAFFNKFDLSSTENQKSLVYLLTFIVRKAAHVFEYFILSILSCRLILTVQKYTYKFKMLITFIFCFLYAVSDELHQYFVPGRACRVTDVCIDSIGIILAIVLTTIVISLKNKRSSGEK